MIELILEGNFIEIRNADKTLQEIIHKTFRAKDPKTFYSSWQGKRGFKTDGYVYFYSKKNSILPIGFLSVLTGLLSSEKVGVKYKIINRNKTFPMPDIDKIDLNKFLPKKGGGFWTPRDYQIDIIKTCIKEKRGIVVGATGAGKTLTFIMLSRLLNRPTMILVEDMQLAHQTYQRFIDYGTPEKEIGLFQSEQNKKYGKFNIVMVQSIKHFQPYIDKMEVVIVDECHMASSARFQETLGTTEASVVFGFSATPFSSEDKVQRLRVISWLGFPIIKVSLKRLMDEGVLAKAYIRFVKIDNQQIHSDATIATQSVKVLDEEAMKAARSKVIKRRMFKCSTCAGETSVRSACDSCRYATKAETKKNMKECENCHDEKDIEAACDECKQIPVKKKYTESFSKRAEGKRMSTFISPDQHTRKYRYLTTKLVEENEYRHRAAVNIIRKHKDLLKTLGCIINFNFIYHGEEIYEVIKAEFPEYKVALIHGEKTNLKERKETLEKFEKKEIDIIIASTIWKKGIDIINVGMYINLADMKDIIAAIQWLGRGVRKGENKTELFYYDMWDDTNKTLLEHSKHRRTHYLEEEMDVSYYTYQLEEQEWDKFKKRA